MGYYTDASPSLGEYFTWINNTNEGSTQAQTYVNLAYFRFMRARFGLALDIYAFDAGNLDGAAGTYSTPDASRFKENFPEGFAPIAKAAEACDMRLGLWAGADGFGDTAEDEAHRKEIFVALCRELHFRLFKFDTVCGELRREKQAVFLAMLASCRKYAPDLIVLNHRNRFEKAEDAATTFLWQGGETYVDVHAFNEVCAPHHRASALLRGYPPDGKRLCEDHGVCLSSCLDYWQDELVVHLFARCLLLAPQLYGNPWLLRDDEQAQLGYLCALHRRYRQALVTLHPMERLDCCRGNEDVRFVTLVNPSWTVRQVQLLLSSLHLPEGRWQVRTEHPYVRALGSLTAEQTLVCAIPPFRAMLLRLERGIDFPAPIGVDSRPLAFIGDTTVFALYGAPGQTYSVALAGDLLAYQAATLDDQPVPALLRGDSVAWRAPGEACNEGGFLGELSACAVPEDAEALYEAAMFAADNDALEVRTLRRSGATDFAPVQAARDAFFAQDTFVYRGADSRFALDNRADTFFCAATQETDQRIQGGCLRIDLGAPMCETSITFLLEDQEQCQLTLNGSADLRRFIPGCAFPVGEPSACTYRFVPKQVPLLKTHTGSKCTYRLAFAQPVRYLRICNAPLRVASLKAAHINNLFAPYAHPVSAWRGQFHLGAYPEGSMLCVALDGVHGVEGAYAALCCEGAFIGPVDRAPSYPCNPFEHYVRPRPDHYTYFFPLTDALKHREIEAYVLGMPWGERAFAPKAYVIWPESPLHHGVLRLFKRI